ncbi:hypothetical protein PPACK8108_LOCUS15640 [Phakopsora pachyrhizi]|uniref:Uncharacterized protein n=1 Tax=Phakopsora pachyrhizi TaxID=170000 RepID=A0AAV0BBX3_PHAPC|nr:hypothetical protein PPACK8108_LOCUS15640 [Phakopsora pachyrhizi]
MERQGGTVETEQPKKKSIHKMAEGGSKVRTRMKFQINKLNVDGQHLKEKPKKRNKGWNLHWSKCKIETKRDVLVVQDLGKIKKKREEESTKEINNWRGRDQQLEGRATKTKKKEINKKKIGGGRQNPEKGITGIDARMKKVV